MGIDAINLLVASGDVSKQGTVKESKAKNDLLQKISDVSTKGEDESNPKATTVTIDGIKLQVNIQNDSQSASGLTKKENVKSTAADLLLSAGVTAEKIDALKAAGVTEVTIEDNKVINLTVRGIKLINPLSHDVFVTIANNQNNLGKIIDVLTILNKNDQIKLLALLSGLKQNSKSNLIRDALKSAINKYIAENNNTQSEIYKILSEIFLEDSIIEKMVAAWEIQRQEDKVKFEKDLAEKTKEKLIDEKDQIAQAKKSLLMAIMVGDISKIKEATSVLISNGGIGAITADLKSDKSLSDLLNANTETNSTDQKDDQKNKNIPVLAKDQRIALFEDAMRRSLGLS